MGWRTVVVTSRAKLECSLGNLIARDRQGFRKIPINEINVVLVETTTVSITAALIAELSRKKVKLIFCDEKHNPISELVSFYGTHDSSACLRGQIAWDKKFGEFVWTEIVKEKIKNQRNVLLKWKYVEADLLTEYLEQVEIGDASNREGHAAKVYFNTLFGKCFSRSESNYVNAALNYGYAVFLSAFNREIVSSGYLTQFGIFHHNVHNHFNLSCDLIEPFRPLIDNLIVEMKPEKFELEEKLQLVDLLNNNVKINNQYNTVYNAIKIYTKSVLDALNLQDISKIQFFYYEL